MIKEVIQIQGISHGGVKRSETFLKQRHPERSHGVGKKSAVKQASPTAHDRARNSSLEELLRSKTLKKIL